MASTALIVSTHLSGLVVIILTLVWNLGYRGGLAWEAENKQLIFNLHPVLLVGFIFLYGEAILVYRLSSAVKSTKKLIHTTINLVAFILAIVGIAAAIKYHNELGIANFYSLHSWFGLVTVILFFIQFLFGFYAFLYPGAELAVRQVTLPWHTFLGVFIYILALTTTTQGILEKMGFLFSGGVEKFGSEATLANFLGLSVYVFGGLVILTAVQSEKGRDEESFRPLQ